MHKVHESVVVGIKEAGEVIGFVKKIQSFLKQAPAEINLIQVVGEKVKIPSFYTEILGSFDLTELDRQRVESNKQKAQSRLRDIKESLGGPDNLLVQAIVSDHPAAALIAESKRKEASMIAIEVEEHPYQFIPQGLSVALCLMQTSPLPVLLLRQGSSNHFEKRESLLVIADDLSLDSLSAVRKGIQLATEWGHTHIIHLHVIEQNMYTTLKDLGKLSKDRDLGPVSSPELYSFLEQQVKLALEKRALEYQSLLNKSKCSYETVIQSGNVAHKVSALLRERKPDLAIFGRREHNEYGPFGVGRVPFSMMLGNSEALMIVP